jgi:hypothetical protein
MFTFRGASLWANRWITRAGLTRAFLSFSWPLPTQGHTSVFRWTRTREGAMTAAVTRKREDVLNSTRTAAEYRSASAHLWELAAGQIASSAREAIALLAAEYENIADQGDSAEAVRAKALGGQWCLIADPCQ